MERWGRAAVAIVIDRLPLGCGSALIGNASELAAEDIKTAGRAGPGRNRNLGGFEDGA